MNQTVALCRDCHSTIHQLVPREKDLGRNFYTLEKLRAHPPIAKFVAWVRKQR